MKNSFYTLLFLVFSLSIFAQNNTIPFIKETIKIDGKLDESVWEKASLFTDFNNFYPNDVGKAENQTEVRVFHDGENLYIGTVYFDKSSKARVSTLKRDSNYDLVVSSDSFGVIIDTYNKKNYGYYFAVNASNAQMDGLVEFNGSNYDNNENWNTVWQSETSVSGTNKFCEIVIPLKQLSFDLDNDTWGIQFFTRDSKINLWMTYTDVPRNFYQFDLRHTAPMKIENLPKINAAKFIVTPSIAYNFQKDVTTDTNTSEFIPSLDAQYRLTSSLRLDATINPDFSQIDVDRQVTNLTRFAIIFPERRNFFIENSDLFTNLGTDEVNPFNSRRIGATNDISLGLKLSGSIAPKTRLGVLNVQTDKNETSNSQNYGALVLQQQLSKAFTTTGFLVNRQETDGFKFQNDFNRVAGVNLNYKSTDTKWTGLANFGKSFTSNISDKNNFYNLGVNYATKEVSAELSASKVEQNYLTDIGFVPRLYNYNSVTNTTVREGYSRLKSYVRIEDFPKDVKNIQGIRYLRAGNNLYFDDNGEVLESASFTNHALFFENLSAVYIRFDHRYVNLKYGFDPLQNGNFITPNIYNFFEFNTGFYSANNRDFTYETNFIYGNYFNGNKTSFFWDSSYRFLPLAKLGFRYALDHLNLKELGEETFHLLQFSGEVFFNNRLNWTTYAQYNTQFNNFNINSRLQWEYKPLSYMYLVVTDNFNKQISRTNWGVAFKMNYRFDF